MYKMYKTHLVNASSFMNWHICTTLSYTNADEVQGSKYEDNRMHFILQEHMTHAK